MLAAEALTFDTVPPVDPGGSAFVELDLGPSPIEVEAGDDLVIILAGTLSHPASSLVWNGRHGPAAAYTGGEAST